MQKKDMFFSVLSCLSGKTQSAAGRIKTNLCNLCNLWQQIFAQQIPYFCAMGEISLQDAINQFLQKSRLKSGIQALRIEDVWEEVMGKTVAKYTDKIQIINATLFITTTVAPLKNELLYQKEKIIERVNEALGEKTIKEVVIK